MQLLFTTGRLFSTHDFQMLGIYPRNAAITEIRQFLHWCQLWQHEIFGRFNHLFYSAIVHLGKNKPLSTPYCP